MAPPYWKIAIWTLIPGEKRRARIKAPAWRFDRRSDFSIPLEIENQERRPHLRVLWRQFSHLAVYLKHTGLGA